MEGPSWMSRITGSDSTLQEVQRKQEATDATLQAMQKRLDELTEKVQILGRQGKEVETAPNSEVVVPIMSETMKSTGPEASKYSMQESIWDATLLLFVGHAGASDMALLIIGMCVNSCFQVGLLVTISFNMLNSQFGGGKISEMVEWRVQHGHQSAEFDPVLGMSHQQRLCSENNKLWSFEQSEYDLMYEYLYKPIPGAALSIMAIVLWVLTCMREYRSLVEQLLAVLHLPNAKKGPNGRWETVEDTEDCTYVVAIRPIARVLVVLTLTLPRLAVLLVLSVVGCVYLARTATLADIVLNAVALAFVLDIDEALCHVLFSQRVRTSMARIQPISCGGRGWAVGGIALKDVLRYACTLGLILGSFWGFVLPFRTEVESAAVALCGGATTFTIEGGTLAATNLVVNPYTADYSQVCDEIAYEQKFYNTTLAGARSSASRKKQQERLRNLTKFHVMSYALVGCPPGQLLTPRHPTPNQPRQCQQVTDLFQKELSGIEVASSNGMAPQTVQAGGTNTLPSCPRFSPQQGAGTCNVTLPEACEWGMVSTICENHPPGDWQREACGTTIADSCNMWHEFGYGHPTKNCHPATQRCPDTDTEGTCLSIAGQLEVGYRSIAIVDSLTTAQAIQVETSLGEAFIMIPGVNPLAKMRARVDVEEGTIVYFYVRSMGPVHEDVLMASNVTIMNEANRLVLKRIGVANFFTSLHVPSISYHTDEEIYLSCEDEELNCNICKVSHLCAKTTTTTITVP